MQYLSASAARQRFLRLIDEVEAGDQVVVTRHGVPAVVLVDFERLETLKSLARLWQDPEALRAMKEASDDVSAGRVLRTKRALGVDELLRTARKRGLIGG